MWVLYLFPGSSSGSIIFLWLVGGHTFKVWISAVVQNKAGERRRRGPQAFWWKDVWGIWSVEREGAFCQSSVAEQVWLGASLGTVPTRRQCVASADCSAERERERERERRTDSKGETERHKCVCGGCLRLTGRRGLVCICMWSGQVVIQQESGKRQGRKNEGRFPGQCYVTSSITDHSPSVYKQRWLNLQSNLYPVLTNEESMEQLAQFI